MTGKKYDANRYLLKDSLRKRIDFFQTAPSGRQAAAPLQKPCPADVSKIDLPCGAKTLDRLAKMPAGRAISSRESVRQ